jgi:hypothetical protein
MRTISIIRPPDRSPIDTQFYGWTRSPLCLCHESTSTRYLHETHCLYLQEKFKSVHVPKNCILHPRTTPSSPPSPKPYKSRLASSPAQHLLIISLIGPSSIPLGFSYLFSIVCLTPTSISPSSIPYLFKSLGISNFSNSKFRPLTASPFPSGSACANNSIARGAAGALKARA